MSRRQELVFELRARSPTCTDDSVHARLTLHDLEPADDERVGRMRSKACGCVFYVALHVYDERGARVA